MSLNFCLSTVLNLSQFKMLLVSINGHLLPCVRMLSIRSQRGWRPKTKRRMFGGRNSFPGPRGESRCALSMSSKLKSYFSNIAKLCFVASSESSKMNSGAEGVLHNEAMTSLILLRRSLSQSNCVVLGAGSSETSRSLGSLQKRKGKSLHSPSI